MAAFLREYLPFLGEADTARTSTRRRRRRVLPILTARTGLHSRDQHQGRDEWAARSIG